MQLKSLFDLYQYFDDMFLEESDSTACAGSVNDNALSDADKLFASSYIRGFVALEAAPFGDEQQLLSTGLVSAVTNKLHSAKSELNPQDQAIVNNFWQDLQANFSL